MKNFLDELAGYRVKVERDGKEIVNVPGILALPAALVAPQASIIGTVAASLLGCSIHLENEAGKTVDIGKLMSSSGYTSKKDKDHHGYGLMNVRRAVENCNGIIKAESNDSSFTLSIMMPREQVSK